MVKWQNAKGKLVLSLSYCKMSEACETCSGGCATIAVIFMIAIVLVILYALIEGASDWEFSEWIGDWFRHWIDKLPKPKDED